MELIDKFKKLPDELKHIIINYTNVIVYRHGKYINRVRKSDEKYRILYNIPKPISVKNNIVILKLIKYNYVCTSGYIIKYYYGQECIKINITFVVREVDGFDRYFDIKSDINLFYS